MSPYPVWALVPSMIDDPEQPSGGNHYDRRVLEGLRGLGVEVREHLVDEGARRDDLLETLPDGAVVLVDGLVASWAGPSLLAHSARLRIVLLLHMDPRPSSRASASEPVSARWSSRASASEPVSRPPRAGSTAGDDLLSAAAAVITTSRWLRDQLPRPAYVALPGVDPAPLAAPSPGGSRLLCVAAVVPTKGHDVLLAALAELDRTAPGIDWRLTCVGSTSRDPHHVGSLHHDDRVRLTGPRTGAALAASYAAADLLVLPTLAESYGMVLTEALARGIPVVASDVGGVSEAVGGAGVLVPPGDPVALAAALRDWLTDPTRRARLRDAARRRRTTLAGWDQTARRVAEVLDRVHAGVSA